MLVLSRKPGETVLIGQDVRVTVAEVRGQRVRLAIEAPRHVPIFRQELCLSQAQSLAGRPGRRRPEDVVDVAELVPDLVVF